MTHKLSEFRLESYDERHVLGIALGNLPPYYRDAYAGVISRLKLRLSQTECQSGGCSICRPDLNPGYH